MDNDNQFYESPNNGEDQQKKSSGIAIASMVLGIISIVICWTTYVAIVIAAVGLVLGIVAVHKGGPGKGMAIAGIVTASIGMVFGIGLSIFVIWAYNNPEFMERIKEINEMTYSK